MTAYIEGPRKAHVVRWAWASVDGGRVDGWRPICRVRERMDPINGSTHVGKWPIHHHGQPSVPWCSFCVAIVQREVDEATADVLDPAAGRAS